MGIYAEYLNNNFDFLALTAERKAQLAKIAQIRGRDVLVFAADMNKGGASISINYSDLIPFEDQIENLSGNKIDLIIETPGGSGEAAEDIVRLLRGKFTEMGVIVPGYAKSAGTIIAMAADEILMGKISALGPIDAQLQWQGKVFSADALLEGFDKIKKEVVKTNSLNKAYIPILQGISPGELQAAENAKNFAIKLVRKWLATYKFKNWMKHSDGSPVTQNERKRRAAQIARKLSNHGHWLTHGRSLKISDLTDMKLKITDYSNDQKLNDAISRYFTLLQMTFQTNIYKLFETQKSQIYRYMNVAAPPAQKPDDKADIAVLDVKCQKCFNNSKVQANLGKKSPLQAGHYDFPADNKYKCPACGVEIDLSDIRRQIEAQAKKKVIL